MRKSKIDRVCDLFEARLREAIDEVRLEEHHAGRHGTADTLNSLAGRLGMKLCAMGTYERLELSDIIMGHKRAWPET